ncbi:MAG: hypothetical protein J6Y68_04160 [Clostridia bacterium]|nr:hypothetical protein [Clostridia bacterium]MBP5648969.1 hypothetical protein [Clostridia bacterium]
MKNIRLSLNLLVASIIVGFVANIVSSNAGDFAAIGVVGSVVSIIGSILELAAYFIGGKENKSLLYAGYCAIIVVILGILSTIMGQIELEISVNIGSIVDMVSSVAGIACVYFALRAFGEITRNEKTRKLSKTTFIVYIITTIITIIAGVALLVLLSGVDPSAADGGIDAGTLGLIGVFSFITLIAALVYAIMYLVVVFKVRREVNDPSYERAAASDNSNDDPFKSEY